MLIRAADWALKIMVHRNTSRFHQFRLMLVLTSASRCRMSPRSNKLQIRKSLNMIQGYVKFNIFVSEVFLSHFIYPFYYLFFFFCFALWFFSSFNVRPLYPRQMNTQNTFGGRVFGLESKRWGTAKTAVTGIEPGPIVLFYCLFC